MRGEDQPSARCFIIVNYSLNLGKIPASLFKKVSADIVQIGFSAIESLAASATASKVPGGQALGLRPRTAYGVGKAPKGGTRRHCGERASILDNRLFESTR